MSKDYEIKIVFENITNKLAEKVYDAIDELISHDFTDNYSMLGKNYVRLEVKDQQISELQHQLKVSEKALELALKNGYWSDKEHYLGTPPSQEEYVNLHKIAYKQLAEKQIGDK